MDKHTCCICDYVDTDGLYQVRDNKWVCYACIYDAAEVLNTAFRKFVVTYGANA